MSPFVLPHFPLTESGYKSSTNDCDPAPMSLKTIAQSSHFSSNLTGASTFNNTHLNLHHQFNLHRLDPRLQPEFLHLWSGFYYGEMAATELSVRLTEMAPDRHLQRFSAETHHEDEQWHAEVFQALVQALPGHPDMPAPPTWAQDVVQKVRNCNSYLELTVGSLVIEASAVFLLELQADFPDELGQIFRRMLLQEKGHVAFASRYLHEHFRNSDAQQRKRLKSLMLDTFRYMRDSIRPQFIELHLSPVLPLLGISVQDYQDRARMASRDVIRSILRPR